MTKAMLESVVGFRHMTKDRRTYLKNSATTVVPYFKVLEVRDAQAEAHRIAREMGHEN